MIKPIYESTVKCHWDRERICKNGMFCGMCEYQPADDDKLNGRKDPVPIRWENDYGMMMPYCPSCGEMAYSTERCVFCGQKLLPTEQPQKNEREIIGGYADKEGILRCDKCKGDELAVVSHEDGSNFFGWTYKCERCGNHVSIRTYRIGAKR